MALSQLGLLWEDQVLTERGRVAKKITTQATVNTNDENASYTKTRYTLEPGCPIIPCLDSGPL